MLRVDERGWLSRGRESQFQWVPSPTVPPNAKANPPKMMGCDRCTSVHDRPVLSTGPPTFVVHKVRVGWRLHHGFNFHTEWD